MLIYFLPTILALGIVTSWEDVKEGKIRNKYLIAAMIVGILTHIILIISKLSDLAALLTNATYALFTLIIGILVWYFGWWSAGDAKLLAAFVFLMPARTYINTTTQLPFIELILNCTIPVFLYLLFIILFKTDRKTKFKAIKDAIHYKRVLKAVVTIFSITWLNLYLFQYLNIQPNIITNMLLIFIVVSILEKTMMENTFPILIIASILRLFLNTHHYLTKTFLTSFLLMIIIYIIISGFVNNLAESYKRKTNIHDLRPGMCLGEGILKTGLKAPLRKAPKEEYILTKRKPLTKEDILKIKKWHSAGKLHFNTLLTQQTLPFAPHIFIGAITTIISRGNLIMFLKEII